MLGIVIACLSLMGVPLTAGFISKWYMVLAALQADLWPVAAFIVVGSMITVIYVWRLVETAYFQEPDGDGTRSEAPAIFLVSLWAVVLANLYFGIDTRFTVPLTELASQYLFALDGVAQ
jgi:multicomponent Na+:H+ antiporter subunit D